MRVYIGSTVPSKNSAAFPVESSTHVHTHVYTYVHIHVYMYVHTHTVSLTRFYCHVVLPSQQLHEPAAINTAAATYFLVTHQPMYN